MIDIVVKSPLGTVDLLLVGEINIGQGLPLLQKRRDEFVQFFQGFRRLIDSGSGERFDVLVGIICEFCPVEEEIMEQERSLGQPLQDIRGLKKPGTEPGRKVWAVKRSPFSIMISRESKVFKITSMMSCHNNHRSALGITG